MESRLSKSAKGGATANLDNNVGRWGKKSKSPPCRRKRDKDGAPSRVEMTEVEMSERVGQPPSAAKAVEVWLSLWHG